MPFAWKPAPGQVALIELNTGNNDCLTGVVLDDDGEGSVVVDLGASPRPPQPECEVVASFFAPDALYRMKATLSPHGDREAVIDLDIHDIERVQRRTAPRARLSIPVVLSNFDDPADDDPSFTSVKGHSVDLGEGGCRVLVPSPFPSGCDPTVTLQLPSGNTVVALAAVLQAAAVAGGGYEYRLVFLEMEELDRLRLAELVAAPAPA